MAKGTWYFYKTELCCHLVNAETFFKGVNWITRRNLETRSFFTNTHCRFFIFFRHIGGIFGIFRAFSGNFGVFSSTAILDSTVLLRIVRYSRNGRLRHCLQFFIWLFSIFSLCFKIIVVAFDSNAIHWN